MKLRNAGITMLLALALALVACAKPETYPSACPPPPALDPPALRYPNMPDDADIASLVIALRLDWSCLMAEVAKRDTLLDAYRQPKKREKAK